MRFVAVVCGVSFPVSFSKTAAFSSKYPKVGVHGGFWHAYQRMKPGMMKGLATAFSKSGARAALFVGHSLGAAMAELGALDLKLNEYSNKIFATYTQGSPRGGDDAYATLFSKHIAASFREVHQADCVPHLPPMLLGFTHEPTEIWFNSGFSKFTVCSGTNGEDKKCSNSLLMPVSVTDHINYRGISVGGYCASGKAEGLFEAVQPIEVSADELRAEAEEGLAQQIQAQKQAKLKKNKILREY